MVDFKAPESYDDNYDEDTLLYVEVDPTVALQLNDELKIYGFDTKEPLLQISNRFFQGKRKAFVVISDLFHIIIFR